MSQTHSSPCDSASRMRTRVGSPSTRKVSASSATEPRLSSAAFTRGHAGRVGHEDLAGVGGV